MERGYYQVVKAVCRGVFRSCSRPLVLHRERAERQGGYLLATNHRSPFDVAVSIIETPRMVEWISIVELYQYPLVAWFFSNMGAVPLDRSRPDPRIVREVVRKLRNGRVVGIFPESGLRSEEKAAIHGGGIKPGLGHIARLGKVPVIPCFIAEASVFSKSSSWLPFNRVVYGIAYGEAIFLDPDKDKQDAVEALEDQLIEEWKHLNQELRNAWPA